MGEDFWLGGGSGLPGRHAECGVLDELINLVQSGGSRVLVVWGEPGVGKSVLLDYLAGRAAVCRVVRAAGAHVFGGAVPACPRPRPAGAPVIPSGIRDGGVHG